MIYMDQKGRDENKDQLQGGRRRRRGVNVYKEFWCLQGKTQRFRWGVVR